MFYTIVTVYIHSTGIEYYCQLSLWQNPSCRFDSNQVCRDRVLVGKSLEDFHFHCHNFHFHFHGRLSLTSQPPPYIEGVVVVVKVKVGKSLLKVNESFRLTPRS